MKYYTTLNRYNYVLKNKLEKQLYQELKKFESLLIMDESRLDELKEIIQKTINDVNAAHPKCKPCHMSVYKTGPGEKGIVVNQVWCIFIHRLRGVMHTNGYFELFTRELEFSDQAGPA